MLSDASSPRKTSEHSTSKLRSVGSFASRVSLKSKQKKKKRRKIRKPLEVIEEPKPKPLTKREKRIKEILTTEDNYARYQIQKVNRMREHVE